MKAETLPHLRHWRKLLGYSLEEVGHQTACHITQLSRHETGIHPLPDEKQQAVERFLLLALRDRMTAIGRVLAAQSTARRAIRAGNASHDGREKVGATVTPHDLRVAATG
jgi:hypothetical protein